MIALVRIDPPLPAARNMAEDLELLRRAEASGNDNILVRIYEWERPSISLGVSQNPDCLDLDAMTRDGVDWVRRVTGGKAVLHHGEITYSLAARIPHPVFGNGLMESYLPVARRLRAFFRSLDVAAEIANERAKVSSNPVCFDDSSIYEISFQGSKIAGSAQKRTAKAFMQHGSLPVHHLPGEIRRYLVGNRESVGASTDAEKRLGTLVAGEFTMEGLKTALARFLRDWSESAPGA